MGLLVSQLNNYTLAPISAERVGEAAGVNSSISSFGLSVGLAFGGAILLAALSIAFTNKSDASDVLPAADKEQIAQVLEDDAEVMSDAGLEEQLAGRVAGGPSGGRAHQRRSPAAGAPDRVARSPVRGPPRPVLLIPDDAVARSGADGHRGGRGFVAASLGSGDRSPRWRDTAR